MAIRLLLRRQRGAVWSRAMVFAEPPYALRFSHFRAKAWNVEGARYFFLCGGIFGFERVGGSKNRWSKGSAHRSREGHGWVMLQRIGVLFLKRSSPYKELVCENVGSIRLELRQF
jgi:hypothetical protein